MPRVKIDYVVSFSSEDPDNQASNLLSWEVDKKRWLCGKWESSCSVVLQLVRAVQISAIHIGAHHAALVEVLVGRSETPNEPFQVLVPSCVFLSPAESRRDPGAGRVRSFTADHLAAAAAQRWDRVRVVCSQPYNKHCKYGLTFVHVYEPEGAPAAPSPAAPSAPAAPASPSSSSEDEYRPGQLFAASSQPNTDTGAQIRKATSQILKNISDSSKIVKSPIIKNSSKKQNAANDSPGASRDRDILMYTDEDKPHTKIDQVVERHRHEKKEKDASKPNVRDSGESSTKTNLRDGDKKHNKNDSDANENSKRNIQDAHRSKEKESSHSKRETKKRKHDDDESNTTTHHKTGRDNSSAKRRETDASDKHRPSTKDNNAGAPLAGAGVVFSGYVHPRRGLLQRAAAALGARVLPAWGPAATHLVCAFPDTPKLREVRAQGARGARAPAATGEWLEAMSRAGRALPWRWFASEPHRRRAPPPPGDAAWLPAAPPAATPDDDDTDDEIERVLQQKKAQKSKSNSPRTSPTATSEEGGETEEEQGADSDARGPARPPRRGRRGRRGRGRPRAARCPTSSTGSRSRSRTTYIQAYGGVIVEMSHMESESDVDYVVCGGAGGGGVQGGGGGALEGGGGRRVRADWVWRCHHAQTLLG
ncbi:LOW QUALITY PROTEIN: DNA repair protein XRCC1 [Achroia grisella]|uniref:LOW QUALITY PROTEIN: DNA repair protein XRCC1 n=1 Tax=Achroia grisella TaxID=688607 RepID=UPI0027D27C38|nr:LOW QUALITY PROTEIN: DNA repair protein XRCC1 [Achroia grisella]